VRAEFARAFVELSGRQPNALFITGDLGFMALEEVQAVARERFINAGVSEQNMVAVAAGLAREGFVPWIYSIAPFAVFRPYEQIRIDVCLHNLPVKIVGNGGGFGYGIMGATHHALEDIAVMRVLPNMRVYVPLVSSDVEEAVRAMALDPSPNYLRLNTSAAIGHPVPPFQQWRKIKDGTGAVVVGTGPVLLNVLQIRDSALLDAVELWNVSVFPIRELPPPLLSSIRQKRKVVTMEEHYGQCGLHEALAPLLLDAPGGPIMYRGLSALGYPSGKYGSQRWHQEENHLQGPALETRLREFLHA
jgi:transketolase